MSKVDVKQAVKLAAAYYRSLMDENVFNLTLEEVELSDNEQWWSMTLSADIPIPPPPPSVKVPVLGDLFSPSYRKAYRVFTISADTGKVKSMKIRTVEDHSIALNG